MPENPFPADLATWAWGKGEKVWGNPGWDVQGVAQVEGVSFKYTFWLNNGGTLWSQIYLRNSNV